MIIAIDGPVASGKSTIARQLAHELGFYYLYTGLLYRGIAYVLVKKLGYTDADLVHPRHADVDAVMQSGRFVYRYAVGEPSIIFDGEDITPELKKGEVDGWSSLSSADPYVRHAIFETQVALGKKHDLVAEGRDIGTVVFPHAEHKFFLTASLEQRAFWWRKMQEQLGRVYSLDESLREVAERDRRDTTREHSPLAQAADAIVVDATGLGLEEVIGMLRERVGVSPALRQAQDKLR